MLVTGAGTLGQATARICAVRGLPCRLTRRDELDIADPNAVAALLDMVRPWAVLNTAGYARVDEAEREPDVCRRENVTGPALLAEACVNRGVPFVAFSSDLVFDGKKRTPYVESDPTGPLNVYGLSKVEAETHVLTVHPNALVLRTGALFGPWDSRNFLTVVLRELDAGRAIRAVTDQTVSPVYVPDLVNAALDLLIDGERGLWHIANDGAVTWYDFACMVTDLAGVARDRIVAATAADLALPARRPAYSVLGSERGWLLPRLDDAVARYVRERHDA